MPPYSRLATHPTTVLTLAVNPSDRWQVYARLQELEIQCWCSHHHPLQVALSSPGAAMQCWSVLQQFTASRQTLIDYLKTCWQLS